MDQTKRKGNLTYNVKILKGSECGRPMANRLEYNEM